jgi:hypothetical protein
MLNFRFGKLHAFFSMDTSTGARHSFQCFGVFFNHPTYLRVFCFLCDFLPFVTNPFEGVLKDKC